MRGWVGEARKEKKNVRGEKRRRWKRVRERG